MVTGFAKLGALSERNDRPQAASRPSMRTETDLYSERRAYDPEWMRAALARGAVGGVVRASCSCMPAASRIHHVDGRAYQSMAAALEDAGLTPDDIGYINARDVDPHE